jgi:hypothetical protein
MSNDNFWQTELRKLFQNSATIEDIRFTGRACVGRLSDSQNVKLRFVTLGTHDHYEGIEATIIKRTEGQIDATTFRFGDIIGNVSIDGRPPYVWIYNGKTEWYGYKPTPADFEKILAEVDDYLEMFQEPVQSQTMRQTM